MKSTSVSFMIDRSRLLPLFLSAVVVTVCQAAGALGPAIEFTVQSDPVAMAVADVNGDGFHDIATAHTSGSVSILLGDATGSFTAATHFPILTGPGRIPTSVAIHDLNGDTFPDLVVGTGGIGLSSTVQVMLGTGTGSFGTATTFTAGADPWSVVIGDFTGDGKPDIATTNRNGDDVSILRGNGNGTFNAPINFTVGAFPTTITAGDLNGDGRLDLVTTNANTDNISVLLANNSGSFLPAVHFPAGNYPFGAAIGDLNSDNLPDIAVTDNIDGGVYIFLNAGAGSFTPLPMYATGAGAGSVAIGDINNDTFPDLAVANYFGATVTVLSGTGVGLFVSPVDYPAVDPSYVVIDTFGTDYLPDLAYANEGAGSVSVRLQEITAPVVNLEIRPASLDFGIHNVGTESRPEEVRILNKGSAAVVIDLIGVAGDALDDFPVTSGAYTGITLPPGAYLPLTVSFKPSAGGKRRAEFLVFPAGLDRPLVVPLSGTGGFAKFGKVEVSGPSKIRKGKKTKYRVNITNSGNVTAKDIALRARGTGILSKTSIKNIAPGQTRTSYLSLLPKKSGRITVAFKVVSSNAFSKTVRKTVRVN